MEKVLFDSSCVCGVLDRKLIPGFSEQLPRPGKKYAYRTTQYLRMEFLRRWIKTGTELYFLARRLGSLEEALVTFSQRYSIREVKVVTFWAAKFISALHEAPTDEPTSKWGTTVLRLALTYDCLFGRFASVKTGCKRGEVRINQSAVTVREALQDFYERFEPEDHICRVGELLEADEGFPLLRRIVRTDRKAHPAESRRGFGTLQCRAKDMLAEGGLPDCSACWKVGDLLIALEQPPSWVLYHVDHLFDALCPMFDSKHVKVKSISTLSKSKSGE